MAYIPSYVLSYVKAAVCFLAVALWACMVTFSLVQLVTCPEPAAKEPKPVPVVVEHYRPDYQPDPHLVVMDGMLVIAS